MKSKGKVILVVDDESAIRKLIAAVLAAQGFKALEASNGLEALQVYGSYRAEIALVITDVQMPVMDGLEAAARIRSISPEIPVILMTGAGGDLVPVLSGWQPLRKPFKPSDLMERVRAVIK